MRHPAASASWAAAITGIAYPRPQFPSLVYYSISSSREQVWFSTKTPPRPTSPSSKTSSYNPVSGMWDNYKHKTSKQNFKQQMEDIANVEKWNLSAYREILFKTANSWAAKVPLLGSSAEVKNAKESLKVADSIMDVLGRQATLEILYNMSRLEKLKAADGARVALERIEKEVLNFESAVGPKS